MPFLSRLIGVSVTAVAATVTAVVLYDVAWETRTAQQAAMRLDAGDGALVSGAEPGRLAAGGAASAYDPSMGAEAALDEAFQDAMFGDGAATAGDLGEDGFRTDAAVQPSAAQPPVLRDPDTRAGAAPSPDFRAPDGQDPLFQDPVVQDPVIQDPALQESAFQESAFQEPVLQNGEPSTSDGFGDADPLLGAEALLADDAPLGEDGPYSPLEPWEIEEAALRESADALGPDAAFGAEVEGARLEDPAADGLAAEERLAGELSAAFDELEQSADGAVAALGARADAPVDQPVDETPQEGPEAAFEAFVATQRAADRLGVGEALRRNYPESDDVLMRALHAAALAGADQRELDRRRTQFVAALLSEKIAYTPYASLDVLRSYVSYNLDLADLARRNFGATACAEAVTQGGAAFSERLRSAPPAVVEEVVKALSDQTGAILDAAREGELNGPRELAPPDSAAWRELHRSMERLGATRTQIGMLMAGGDGTPEDLCAATQTFYAALVSLKDDQALKLLPFVTKTMIGGAEP